jgi:hypothetical protein
MMELPLSTMYISLPSADGKIAVIDVSIAAEPATYTSVDGL